jgi:hypothetical protein
VCVCVCVCVCKCVCVFAFFASTLGCLSDAVCSLMKNFVMSAVCWRAGQHNKR